MSFTRKQSTMTINEALSQFQEYLQAEDDLLRDINDHDCLYCVCPGLESLLPLSADVYCDYMDWINELSI